MNSCYREIHYDPALGRFLTPDPIGLAGGDTNLYRYVNNNPLNAVDPSGYVINDPDGLIYNLLKSQNFQNDASAQDILTQIQQSPTIVNVYNSNVYTPNGSSAFGVTYIRDGQTITSVIDSQMHYSSEHESSTTYHEMLHAYDRINMQYSPETLIRKKESATFKNYCHQ